MAIDCSIITVSPTTVTSLGQNLKDVTVTNLSSTRSIYFGDWALTTSFFGVKLLPGASVFLGTHPGVLCAISEVDNAQLSVLFHL